MPWLMSLFAKAPLIIGLFCRKWPIKIRHLMHQYHPVASGTASLHTSLSAKEPQIIRPFCGKRPMKIRHSMHLRHSVAGTYFFESQLNRWCVKKDIQHIFLHSEPLISGSFAERDLLFCGKRPTLTTNIKAVAGACFQKSARQLICRNDYPDFLLEKQLTQLEQRANG